ncbi:MAG: hypothetical protein ABI833_12120 [Acidobacteriota bacterium]
MDPSTDHEREVVRAVDELANQGHLSVTSVADVAASLGFALAPAEAEFMVSYILWRLTHENPT